ncbi:hypothetical protein GCM10010431_80920 [Streptomyces kunmingensis]
MLRPGRGKSGTRDEFGHGGDGGARPHPRVGNPAVTDLAVLCLMGRVNAVHQGGQGGRLEGGPATFGRFVDQDAGAFAAEVRRV